MNKKYWQSFGELNNTEAYQKSAKDEFAEELPFESADTGLLNSATPRRDFLKYLGFSTTAAMIAASCDIPVKKAIPFANKPEDIIPGVADYYATTYVQDGDAVSILAKVRDGRPIKIEGNEMSPITKGGTSARVQASVLDLYDTSRHRFPMTDGKESSFDAVDKAVAAALGSGNIAILSSTINSPSSLAAIKDFQTKYPNTRHVVYDAVSVSGMLLANEACYGKKAIPSYRFDNAKCIVSIGADFLGTWLSPVEFSKQYSAGKRIDEKNPSMSKHIHFESIMSLTGANADERVLHLPSQQGAVVAALYNALNGGDAGISDAKLKAGIAQAAKELSAHAGEALVVCGSNDVNVQILVNAINDKLGSNGKTIDWSATCNTRMGVDADFAKLVDDMNAGAINTLVVIGANPAYTWYDADKFIAGLKKVATTVSFGSNNDETTQLCKYVIPNSHFLESWGDAEPKTGMYSFMQPTIYPLFKTRQWQDSILKWTGNTSDYLAYIKAFWSARLGGETGWDKALQDGVWGDAAAAAGGASFSSAAVAGALAAVSGGAKSGATEMVLYEKVSVGAAYGANNPWLQEMPDPITRATWDNYIILSPAMAKSLLNIDVSDNGQSDKYEVYPERKVVEISANGKTITLPALIIPGTHPNTIGVALGYGRSEKLGKTATGAGKRAAQFASLINGNAVSYAVPNVSLKVTGDKYVVAVTQTHGSYDTEQGKRTEVMKEMTLAEYKAHPHEILEEREKELEPFGGLEKYEGEGTIYPVYDRPGIKWGLSVDLNTCTGCSACVIACHAENNVPVVGKNEVKRFHDMHWIRIDRYFSGDAENPDVVFQPLMCQHCDNAPCENVCPVAATNHSSEGINQMTYNRCIGTRYCANNCPFKVRRFNWADYTGSDSFTDNQQAQLREGTLDPVIGVMNDDLTRMVLNPDVTVRSRGVIEKCSMCIQRAQAGKLKAKAESRPLIDSDVQTACQQACPTNAIVFGNVNNSQSMIAKTRVENRNRTFYSLEQIHVLPNVNYLAKVRNKEEEKA